MQIFIVVLGDNIYVSFLSVFTPIHPRPPLHLRQVVVLLTFQGGSASLLGCWLHVRCLFCHCFFLIYTFVVAWARLWFVTLILPDCFTHMCAFSFLILLCESRYIVEYKPHFEDDLWCCLRFYSNFLPSHRRPAISLRAKFVDLYNTYMHI